LTPSFDGNLLIQRQEIASQQTRDSRLSYGEDPESLSHLGLNRYRVVSDGRTDGQTDRITIAFARNDEKHTDAGDFHTKSFNARPLSLLSITL